MIVHFKMEVNEEIVEFKTIGKLTQNILQFKDMNNKQNTILVEILEDKIIIEQLGTTTMKNTHILNVKTDGYYKGAHNVEGPTNCITTNLIIENNYIEIDYIFYFNNNLASENKLTIKY